MSDTAKEDEPLRGKRILWVDDPSELRTMAIYMDDLMAAGAEVTLLTSVDSAIETLKGSSRRPFDLVIYAMWMATGEAFADYPTQDSQATGRCFEAWLRSPMGGNLPSDKLPLLLYTHFPDIYLERHALKPKGVRDRTVHGVETSPSELVVVLTEMLVKVA